MPVEHRRCELPDPGERFERAAPDQVGMSPDGIRRAVAAAQVPGLVSFRVFRHNCEIARGPSDPFVTNLPNEVWSATKAIVALVVGRAEAMGALDLDDPISRYFPGIRPDVGRITIRQLLTQTSGLRFNWANDIAATAGDSVAWTLSLPVDHEPGTRWNYGQTTATTLLAIVGEAVNEDPARFARRELFDPIGVGAVTWTRDGAQNPVGFAGLKISPDSLARLGAMVGADGVWKGQRLLNTSFVEALGERGVDNEGYGFMWWTNAGPTHVLPPMFAAQTLPWRHHPALPDDTVAMSGAFQQDVITIPSLDMLIVRTGLTLSDTERHRHSINRALMAAVTDVPQPDRGPYRQLPAPQGYDYLIDLCSLPNRPAPAWLCP